MTFALLFLSGFLVLLCLALYVVERVRWIERSMEWLLGDDDA